MKTAAEALVLPTTDRSARATESQVRPRPSQPPTLPEQLEAPAGETAPLLDRALYAPLRDFLGRPGKGFRGKLTALAYALSGGEGEAPPEMALLVEALHAGSLIVDDIEDASEMRRGAPTMHRTHGLPVALNAGNFLYFLPQRLLRRVDLPDAARLALHEAMGECLLRCHEGQALDLTVRLSQLGQHEVAGVARGISERKTGALMGLATELGAIAAGADRRTVEALRRFGEEVGVGLQLLDDLSGIIHPGRADKGLEDLEGDRPTWAWAILSQELDAAAYGQMIADRATLRGTPALHRLLDRMRFPLQTRGAHRARVHFAAAEAALFEVLGDHPLRPAVRAETERLLSRFLEG